MPPEQKQTGLSQSFNKLFKKKKHFQPNCSTCSMYVLWKTIMLGNLLQCMIWKPANDARATDRAKANLPKKFHEKDYPHLWWCQSALKASKKPLYLDKPWNDRSFPAQCNLKLNLLKQKTQLTYKKQTVSRNAVATIDAIRSNIFAEHQL